MQSKSKSGEFARSKLPWITAGVIFVLYLLTLNRWVSMRSLTEVGKITGWDSNLPTHWPLFFTLTFPIRFFPNGIQPIALNFLSALCGAATVWMITRSVALLPHDRTTEQRMRERHENALLSIPGAWAPPALAAALCGLQLSIWEHATVATNDALNLLIFAYLIRCLLEFRVSQNERWLTKLAFVFGLGVTNSWGLIGYFPFFVIALIWIRGKAFFNGAFILRMLAAGIFGLLLYLVIPLVWVMKSETEVTFWAVLKGMLAEQRVFLFSPLLRARALILALTSILPVAIIGVRFPSGFGDVSSAGAAVTHVMFRVVHIMFAAVCAWIAFDPHVSPRALVTALYGMPFLSFYYLSALAAGYYVGYLMLVATEPPRKQWAPPSPMARLFNPIGQAVAWGAVAIVPLALIYKNFKIVEAQNGKLLQDYAEATAAQIPSKNTIVISDDPIQLLLLDGWLSRSGRDQHILVQSAGLRMPSYHKQLVKRYGDRWPANAAKEDPNALLDDRTVALSLTAMTRSNTLVYLHPSFGAFFETMIPRPKGWVLQLEPYGTNVIYPPRLTAEEVEAGQKFWEQHESLARRAESFSRMKLSDVAFVGGNLSRSLNHWAAQLQRAGKVKEAGPLFDLATTLNTNNIPAKINLEFNESLIKGTPRATMDAAAIEDLFGERYRRWDDVLLDNGPFDAPEFLFGAGNVFHRQRLVRQAADCFSRAAELAPTNALARIALISSLISGGWHDEAVRLIGDVRNSPNATPAQRLELVSMEAAVYYGRRDTNRAVGLLKQAIAENPDAIMFYESLNELYLASQQFDKALELQGQMTKRAPTNIALRLRRADLALNIGDTNVAASELAEVDKIHPNMAESKLYRAFMAIQSKDLKAALKLVDEILDADEKNAQALSYKGVIHMELKEDEQAIEAFTKAFEANPNNASALLNRAIVQLRAGKLKEAKEDYEKLRSGMPRAHVVYYGLGDIAYQRKEKEEALKNYELYLKYAPREGVPADERKRVEDRVKELKGSG